MCLTMRSVKLEVWRPLRVAEATLQTSLFLDPTGVIFKDSGHGEDLAVYVLPVIGTRSLFRLLGCSICPGVK